MIATEFLRKYRDSKAVALKEYYNYSPISTDTESCRYFRETRKKYEKKILGFNKKIRTKLAFPPQQKN
jgi:hypothetical protein